MDQIQTVTEKYALIIAIFVAAVILMVLSYAGRVMLENHELNNHTGTAHQSLTMAK